LKGQDRMEEQPQELQELLEQLWPEVRRRHLFPEIPTPRFESNHSPVAMEMRHKQIILNLEYVKTMSNILPAKTVLETLLDHGISHYTCCPWDLSTHLRFYARAKKILGEDNLARKATDLFMDIVADTHAVKERQSSLPLLYQCGVRTGLEEIICSLYQRIWGVDLGCPRQDETVSRLATIPYLDKRRWMASLSRFIRGIRPLLEEGNSTLPDEHPRMGKHGFKQYAPEDIEQALREFAVEAESPEQFADIFADLQDQLEKVNRDRDDGMGHGAGSPVDANRLYYMKLAENYALPLRKKDMKGSGHLHPHSHRPWEVCQPFQDLDPWCSFGKYLPGITQIWQRKEGQIYGKKEKTPDCLVIIDSSGSMVDPRTNLSYAVLGGGCAADTYLRYDAGVAVYNFSDALAGGKEHLPFTRSRSLIYQVLCRYFGGGTALDLDEVTGVAEASEADIFLITDMQITNLDQTISRFSRLHNRVTAVHVGKKSGALRFIKASVKNKNISVFGVNSSSDIPRIVLGSIRNYLAPE
jgi:hypothetical protein